jgi:hypothetical protein
MYQTNLNWFEMHKKKEALMWAELLPIKFVPNPIEKKYDFLNGLTTTQVFFKGFLKGLKVSLNIYVWLLFFYILWIVCRALSGG